MRVIAGTARRTTLEVAPDSSARPMLEMARGGVFNHLGARVTGARVLDLFAGSGALGIEALSRGAAACHFVESDRRSVRVIEANLARCGLADRARLHADRVERVLPGWTDTFSLVFVDPPFADAAAWRGEAAGRLRAEVTRLLAPGGRVVFRYEETREPPPAWEDLVLAWDRVYGRSRLCIFAAAGGDGAEAEGSASPAGGGQG